MPQQKLKFPVIPDIEFIDILKNKSTLKTYKNNIKGITWRDFQALIGKDCGAGVYNYVLRINNESTQHTGIVRAIGTLPKEEKQIDNSLKIEIESLKKRIETIGTGTGIGYDLLISVTKQSFETQITFLNGQLQSKDAVIVKLENKIESLENELNESDEIIEDLKSKTGINQYLEIAQTFLKGKLGNTKPLQTLKDSNPDDIPGEIIKLLGTVQWNKVEQNVIDQIVFYLNAFIPKLPLKGN